MWIPRGQNIMDDISDIKDKDIVNIRKKFNKLNIDFEKELHKKTKELETQLKKCEIISKKL